MLIFLLHIYALQSELVLVPGGSFPYGSSDPSQGEHKLKQKKVESFYIDETPVTNGEFQKFVEQTDYKTEAERKYGWSFVFEMLYPGEVDDEFPRIQDSPYWLAVENAFWNTPEGKDSTIEGREDFPVVQVSYRDARKYCNWAGKRLLSEMEWEYAARGGQDTDYWWGSEPTPEGSFMMNFWQGDFPKENTKNDGHIGQSPVREYPPNQYGIYDMVGNVWEWTRSYKEMPGPEGKKVKKRVIRGGSFIDSMDGSFNHKLRVTTRMVNDADSAGNNMGFRCGKTYHDPKEEL